MTEFFFSEETKDIQNPDPKTNIFLPLLKDDAFMEWLNRYYRKFMDLALKEHNQFGFIMMSFMTYKARKEVMMEEFKISEAEWIKMNKDCVQHLDSLRAEYESSIPNCPPIVICGLIVARGGHGGDAFSLEKMTVAEAEAYHSGQIKVLAEDTQVDFLLVALVSYSEEAIGILNVAAKVNLPIVLSFTTEVDGRLLGGDTVKV